MNNLNINPFAKAFWDYYNGNKSAEIIVHCNKGDDDIIPVKYFFRNYDELPELEKIAINNCKGKIIDVGAGSGCHSLILQSLGMYVKAVDISKELVELMNKRGIINTCHIDAFNLKDEIFDTILLLMNGIGFVKDFNGLKKFLSRAKKILNPNSQIILDSSDINYLFTEDDGSVRIDMNSNYYGEIIYQVEYNGILGNKFKWLFVDFYTLNNISNEIGYNCELLYEDDHFNYLAKLS
ncbi:MAG: class I SAM-dependent methyltransferase [Bacteroidales bacterium]|nr:class I SAM-dependent methyltransferase [Bacteroidales bacterium]